LAKRCTFTQQQRASTLRVALPKDRNVKRGKIPAVVHKQEVRQTLLLLHSPVFDNNNCVLLLYLRDMKTTGTTAGAVVALSLLLLLQLPLDKPGGAAFAQGTDTGRASEGVDDADGVVRRAFDAPSSSAAVTGNRCVKADEMNACDATLHCHSPEHASWPALSPDDGWKTTVLRKDNVTAEYFDEYFGNGTHTLGGLDLSWRFVSGADGVDDVVEFAVTSWGTCARPHVKIGFPENLPAAGHAGRDEADKDDESDQADEDNGSDQAFIRVSAGARESAGGGDDTAASTSTTTATFIVEGEDRDTSSSCAGLEGLNLKGELLNDGASLIKDKAEDCCQDCRDLPECNTWVFCEGDCVDYAHHSCWLKRAVMTGFNLDEASAAW
jgi:hypothetical protein